MNKNFGNKLNKILGCVLFVAFVVLFSSNFVEIIYDSINDTSKRGHIVEIEETTNSDSSGKKEFSFPNWDIPKLIQTASKENGEKIFNKCKSCHNIVASEGNKVGPNLNKVIGRLIGSKNDFNYSKKLTSFSQDDQKWTQENFFKYIYSPKNFAPGGRMAFAGIKKETEIADLFAYISSIN
jgi:cytochrome c